MSDEIKDFLLGESGNRAAVEAHLKADPAAREEFERLRLTRDLLRSSLAEEEIPRRIAFVSDPIFESTPKWWQRIWQPAWGMAAASMVAGAILAHGWMMKPAQGIREVVRVEAGQADITALVDARVADIVKRVNLENEAKTAKLLQAAEQKYEYQRASDLAAIEKNFDLLRREQNRNVMASFYNRGGAQ